MHHHAAVNEFITDLVIIAWGVILLMNIQAVRIEIAGTASQENRAPEGRVLPSLTSLGRGAPDRGRNRAERGIRIWSFKNSEPPPRSREFPHWVIEA